MSVWDTRVICVPRPTHPQSSLFVSHVWPKGARSPAKSEEEKSGAPLLILPLKNYKANLASLFSEQTSIAFYHLKPFLLLVFAFVLLIFWFIQFSLILLCLCDARSMASIFVTMKVLSTIYTRQNITIVALVLIMFFHLSFPDGLSTRITNKTHHFHNVVHGEEARHIPQ